MRFHRLVVECFRAIRSAEIEFGAGLNVLYGPNDLGKSTLATAIQAALLVPPGSAEAEGYSPWQAGATPRVTLTFVDDDGRFWRVKKCFGDEQTAELQGSKDGGTFSLECRGREVEEKVRTLLAWGIAIPGGKGGPRGLPTSFLSNALLAPQTHVDAILAQSLATDAATTGKVRLSSALATLAQDPLFKKVLDAAQAEVNAAFTPKGKLKRAAGSPFVQATNAVKMLREELIENQRQLQSYRAIEAEVTSQRARYAQGLIAALEAKARRATVHDALEAARARQAAQIRVDQAQAEVAKIEAHANRIAKLEVDLRQLDLAVRTAGERLSRAQAVRTGAEAGLRQGEEVLRLATSEDGVRERDLQRAQLEAKASGLREQLRAGEARKENAAAAMAASEAAAKARVAASVAAADVVRTARAFALDQQRLADATADVEFARALQAYGRWRVACGGAEESARASQSALARNRDAADAEAKATALDADDRAKRAEFDERAKSLPTADQLDALQKLEQELALAEAALDGGGLNVAIHSRGQTTVRALLDGKPAGAGEALPAQAQFAAQRSVKLTVGETVDIEVTAGSPEKLRAIDELKKRWVIEGAPLLARGGATSAIELARSVAAHASAGQALAISAKELERLHAEAKNLREQAARDDEEAARLATPPDELVRLKTLVGPSAESVLAEAFDKLGKGWEPQVETMRATSTKKLELRNGDAKASEQAANLDVYKSGEADKLAASEAERALCLAQELGAADPRALLRTIEAECAALAQQELDATTALHALSEGASGEVAKAEHLVEHARTVIGAAEVELAAASADLGAVRATFHVRDGQCAEAKVQLAELDRLSAEAVLAQRKLELAALLPATAVTEADLAQSDAQVVDADRALEVMKQELHTSEGALSTVGGSSLGEEALRLQEALEVAEQREKDLEVDANAWKLLQETLRAVENEEGAHLGRALAQPLSKKFTQLTGGRYEGLRIDAALKTDGLAVAGVNAGDDDVLEALSVGTRDQLATLIRLTIAEQLKTAIVLDDHLVHTDPERQGWFVQALLRTALESQVVVLTCRPKDYLDSGDVSDSLPPSRDVAAGRIRVVNVGQLLRRWEAQPA